MKTAQEIEQLKSEWLSDPLWDIEDTPGFEEHRAELIAYRLKVEAEARQAIYDETDRLAALLRTSFEVAEYILKLERRLANIQDQIDQLYAM